MKDVNAAFKDAEKGKTTAVERVKIREAEALKRAKAESEAKAAEAAKAAYDATWTGKLNNMFGSMRTTLSAWATSAFPPDSVVNKSATAIANGATNPYFMIPVAIATAAFVGNYAWKRWGKKKVSEERLRQIQQELIDEPEKARLYINDLLAGENGFCTMLTIYTPEQVRDMMLNNGFMSERELNRHMKMCAETGGKRQAVRSPKPAAPVPAESSMGLRAAAARAREEADRAEAMTRARTPAAIARALSARAAPAAPVAPVQLPIARARSPAVAALVRALSARAAPVAPVAPPAVRFVPAHNDDYEDELPQEDEVRVRQKIAQAAAKARADAQARANARVAALHASKKKAPAKKSLTKAPAKKSPARAPAKKSPAKAPAKKSPAKAPAKKSPAKVPAKKSPAKVPAKKAVARRR
jgi:hypothetical protein